METPYSPAGRPFDYAWHDLKDHMETPPSWEVFRHGYKRRLASGDSLSPRTYARSVLQYRGRLAAG